MSHHEPYACTALSAASTYDQPFPIVPSSGTFVMQMPLTQVSPPEQSGVLVHVIGLPVGGKYIPSLSGLFRTGGGGLSGKVQVAAWPVMVARAAVSSGCEVPG